MRSFFSSVLGNCFDFWSSCFLFYFYTRFCLSLKNAILGPCLTLISLNLHLRETLMSPRICNILCKLQTIKPWNYPICHLKYGSLNTFLRKNPVTQMNLMIVSSPEVPPQNCDLIYVFGLARRGSTIGFHLLWHTVELAMSTRLCLSLWLIWFLCFRFDALTELGTFMSPLGVWEGLRVFDCGTPWTFLLPFL